MTCSLVDLSQAVVADPKNLLIGALWISKNNLKKKFKEWCLNIGLEGVGRHFYHWADFLN